METSAQSSSLTPRRDKSNAVDAIVGSIMRQKRLQAGLSRKGLAQKIGVKRRQVKQYERGKMPFALDMVAALCLALKVKINCFSDPIHRVVRKQGATRHDQN